MDFDGSGDPNRAERERAAFDHGDVVETSGRWHMRFGHVFTCPNSQRHERLYDDLLRTAVTGRRVLELGCGDGQNAARLLSLGAAYVYGIDVSEAYLAQARRLARPGRLEFDNRDASQPIGAQFDAIVGRAILHHMDYRSLVRRLFDETLRPNGAMIFMEPLGSNPLIRLYKLMVPRAHTADERSFDLGDLRWFQREFEVFEYHPFNLVSLPAAILSSRLFSRPDNALLRISDAIDTWLARRSLWLDSLFRYTILVIRKSSSGEHGLAV